MPSLNKWFKSPKITSGTLSFHIDILIPEKDGNHVSIQARDYSTKPYTSLLNTKISESSIILADKILKFTPNKWFHLELQIPINNDKEMISIAISQEDTETKKIALINRGIKSLSWLGFMLTDKKDGQIFVDNLVITHEE